ncbi:hypothetical protein ES703_68631 [subsurface metagenome]
MDGYVEEADLTETILVQDASPVTVSCEPDVLYSYTTEINSGIVCIIGHTRRPGKLGSCTQCRIVGAVDRIFNGNIFEPETDHWLQKFIRVPDPHLMEFVNLVEFIFDPGRLRPCNIAQPHIVVTIFAVQ